MKSKSTKTLIRTVTIFIGFICINSEFYESGNGQISHTETYILGFLSDLSNSKNGSFIFIIPI